MVRRIGSLLVLGLCLVSLSACVVEPAPGVYREHAFWVPGHYNGWHWIPGHWA
jgi:hypothetical protein